MVNIIFKEQSKESENLCIKKIIIKKIKKNKKYT